MKLQFHTNRKLYLTYIMVLCLVTLTDDLSVRRAGLSASLSFLLMLITPVQANKLRPEFMAKFTVLEHHSGTLKSCKLLTISAN